MRCRWENSVAILDPYLLAHTFTTAREGLKLKVQYGNVDD